MKTYNLKGKEIQNDWLVVDAGGETLGRLATRVASLLMGKHKPSYTPHLPMGDYVVVTNAAGLRVTGKKLADKVYYRHSGYTGGLKEVTLGELMKTKPERAIQYAVKRMLPQNRLGRALYRRLKVYAGPEHPHEAQVKASQKGKAAAAEPAGEGE